MTPNLPKIWEVEGERATVGSEQNASGRAESRLLGSAFLFYGTKEICVERPQGGTRRHWHGRWVILRGTDELATLRGQGTWWGPGAPDVGLWGDIYYGGNIHFEP